MKRHSFIPSLISIAITLVALSSSAAPVQEASLLQFKENWVSASSKDVLNARCSRTLPFTDREIKDWLDSAANGTAQKVSANIYGIELVDESSYWVSLLQSLLTQDPESHQPQRTFNSSCTKVYCVAKELFGDRAGPQLLFMLGRFGFNGSHIRVEDSSPWTSPELDTLLLSLSDLPKELIPASPLAFNRRLTHYQRREPNPDRSDSLASTALSGTRVYDSWNKYSVEMQRYALYHELGHVFGYVSGLHSTHGWYDSSGWIQKSGGWLEHNGEPAISKYAEGNPIEDFAESFAAYRYNPEKLKEATPRAYDFMRDQLFKGVEYTKSANCVSLYPEPQAELAALEELKDSVLNASSSLSLISLSDDEIEEAKQTCLPGPTLLSAFVSGNLLDTSAQCVRKSEIRKAIESASERSTELRGLNAEWISSRLSPQVASLLPAKTQCTLNCQSLARKGLDQIEHALELVLTGYQDISLGQTHQSAQKFCTDLSSANVQAARGYSEIRELIGDTGQDDFVNASIKVCKVIQAKFRKRQSMSAEQIEAALNKLYPGISAR